jgi:hypothetical protein
MGRRKVAERRDQIIFVALEVRRIGKHRKACRPARLIGAGMRGRIEIGADQAFGGAGLFYLGDQGKASGGFGT